MLKVSNSLLCVRDAMLALRLENPDPHKVHLLIFNCSKVFYAVKLSESNIGNYIFTLNLRTVAFLFFTLRSRAGRSTGRVGSYRVMRGGTPYSSVL